MIRSSVHPRCRARNSIGHTRRAGFTLIEILLAAMLAAFVLAAVYSLFNVTLKQTQTSRDATEIENVAGGVFNMIANDLKNTLAPPPPKSGGNSAAGDGLAASLPAMGSDSTSTGSSSTTSSGSSTPSTTTSGSGSSASTPSTSSSGSGSGTSSSGSGSGTSSSSGTTGPPTALSANYAFSAGVIGHDSEQYMAIYVGRTPEIYGRSLQPQQSVLAFRSAARCHLLVRAGERTVAASGRG